MRGGPPHSGLSLVLSIGAGRRSPRSFDVFQEPPWPFPRERSFAQAVRDGGGALHEGRDRGWRGDASIILADAHRRRGVAKIEDLDPTSNRAVAEYLSVLDDAAFGGATPVESKVISPTDPAARYTASANSVAGYAYSDSRSIASLNTPALANDKLAIDLERRDAADRAGTLRAVGQHGTLRRTGPISFISASQGTAYCPNSRCGLVRGRQSKETW